MTLRLSPVVMIWLLFTAHIMRSHGLETAVFILLMSATLWLRNRYIPFIWQMFIGIATVEWIRTTIYLTQLRIVQELPYERLLIIMGAVILFNIFGIFWMGTQKIKALYT